MSGGFKEDTEQTKKLLQTVLMSMCPFFLRKLCRRVPIQNLAQLFPLEGLSVSDFGYDASKGGVVNVKLPTITLAFKQGVEKLLHTRELIIPGIDLSINYKEFFAKVQRAIVSTLAKAGAELKEFVLSLFGKASNGKPIDEKTALKAQEGVANPKARRETWLRTPPCQNCLDEMYLKQLQMTKDECQAQYFCIGASATKRDGCKHTMDMFHQFNAEKTPFLISPV